MASKGQEYLKTKLDTLSHEHKESVAKWAKDHPNREPGTSTRTWKSFTEGRFQSDAYRQGYDNINWGNG